MSLENEINNITSSLFNNITYQSHEEMISFQSVLVETSDCIQSLYEICNRVFCGYLNLEIILSILIISKKTLNEWMDGLSWKNWQWTGGFMAIWKKIPLKIENRDYIPESSLWLYEF
jgi:hypothetical protein